MRLALGVEVTTLRYVSYSVSKDAHQIDAIYVLESHNPAREPQDGAEWVGRAALADLPLAPPSTGRSLPRIWPRLRADRSRASPTLGARRLV